METKLYAEFTEVKAIDDKELIIEFVVTKEIRDYDGDIVKISGLDISKMKKNKSFLWSHRASDHPVGQISKMWKIGDEIKGRARMTPADLYDFGFRTYRMIKEGFINNISMAFLPDYKTIEYKEEKDGTTTRIINNAIMLEVSAVNIGANNATSIQAKSFRDNINKAWDAGVLDGSELLELEEWLEKTLEEGKPYKGEHSCRLSDPKQYDKFARKNCEMKHDGKCIDVIYGIKGKKSEIQALRFKTDIWTETQAKSYCKDKEGTFEAAKKAIQMPTKPHTDDIDNEGIQDYKKDLNEAEIKIAELELQLAEQKINEEIEEDNLYEELFEEFSLAASDEKSANGKQTEELIDDLKNIRKENNNGK